jgi:hypothetical protein
MTSVKAKIADFFRRNDERIILPVLFVFGLVFHMWLCFYMETYAVPFEVTAPEVINEFLQETRMVFLFMNAMLTALIPVVAYKIAEQLEVRAMWQRVLAALVCGLYPAVISHTKLSISARDWGPGLGVWLFLFPCIIALVILTSANISRKRPIARGFMAILLSLTLAAAIIAHERMTAVALAAIFAAIFARLFLKRDFVPIRPFLISLILFAAAAVFYWGEQIAESLAAFRGGEGALLPIIRGLYSFAIPTWGLGILGFCLFAKCGCEYKIRRKREKLDESELNKHAKLLIFSMFALSAFVLELGFVAASSREYSADIVAPLVLMSCVCMIFVRGLELRTILYSIIAHGLIFTAVFTLTPLTDFADFNEVFMYVSLVFSFMALLIVYVSCGGRFKTSIIAGTIAAVALFFAVYTTAVYLPGQKQPREDSSAQLPLQQEYGHED